MLKVNVSFIGSRVIPVSFVADGREHTIEKVALQYWRRDGGRKYLCFSVSTSGTDTELIFDINDLFWKIGGSNPIL